MPSQEPLLLSSLIAAALAAAGYSASSFVSSPSPSMTKKSKIKRRKGGRPPSSSTTGMNPFNLADSRVVPPRYGNVPTKIPPDITSRIVWDTVKIDGTIITSISAVTETNFVFSISLHPQVAAWTVLFDVWCIPFASVTFQSLYQPGATLVPPLLATALDFDNSAPIGSLSNIEDFASCEATVMSVGTRFTRTVHPCTKLSAAYSSGVSSASPTPSWADSTATSTSMYGIRSLIPPTAGVFEIRTTTVIWFAFRHAI